MGLTRPSRTGGFGPSIIRPQLPKWFTLEVPEKKMASKGNHQFLFGIQVSTFGFILNDCYPRVVTKTTDFGRAKKSISFLTAMAKTAMVVMAIIHFRCYFSCCPDAQRQNESDRGWVESHQLKPFFCSRALVSFKVRVVIDIGILLSKWRMVGWWIKASQNRFLGPTHGTFEVELWHYSDFFHVHPDLSFSNQHTPNETRWRGTQKT